MTVKVGEEKFKRTVLVLAKQPGEARVKAYLAAHDASAVEKLVKQESRFKHVIDLDSEPVVAGDKGYSLTQLTKPPPTYEQVWNWKAHLDGGIALLGVKKKEAKHMLDSKGANSYTQDMLDRETLTRWNGGSYYTWNASTHKWERDSKILCDTQTGNIGWNTTVAANQGKTEAELHARDVSEYPKMKAGQTAEYPWIYTGVCYADHLANQ